MDESVGLIEFILANPVIDAALAVGTFIAVIWLWRDMLRTKSDLTAKITEHEIECAHRWGKVEAKLEEIDRRNCQ